MTCIKLSPQDRQVINALWEKGKMNVNELINELGEEWTRHSVRANLLRLIDKELIAVEKVSARKQYYYALVEREDFLADETSHYLKDRYNGLTHMVAGLAEGRKVSKDELKELQSYLNSLSIED